MDKKGTISELHQFQQFMKQGYISEINFSMLCSASRLKRSRNLCLVLLTLLGEMPSMDAVCFAVNCKRVSAAILCSAKVISGNFSFSFIKNPG